MELTAGLTIGPYRLVAPAGRGGMAEVWRAYHPRLERYVAIKFLSPRFAGDPTYLDRFLREARAISRLDHPSILTVHDFGEQEGWTFMVSPFIGGGTLEARLRRGPWSIQEAPAVLEPLAAALDYAHGQGLVHRDVKPSNVLFTEAGRLVLTDFGIARMVEGSTLLSQAGLVIGTPMYMSPEQADGQPVGPPSDQYSLGVVAYELLTGRPPFQAETPVALLMAHIHKPLPPPRSLNPALPEAVEAVLFKALAKDPADRFGSCFQFAVGLRAAGVAPEPIKTFLPTSVSSVSANTVGPGQEPRTASPTRSLESLPAARGAKSGSLFRTEDEGFEPALQDTSRRFGGIGVPVLILLVLMLEVFIGGASSGLIRFGGGGADPTPTAPQTQAPQSTQVPTIVQPAQVAPSSLPGPPMTTPAAAPQPTSQGPAQNPSQVNLKARG